MVSCSASTDPAIDRPVTTSVAAGDPGGPTRDAPVAEAGASDDGEDGSLVTEYGLLAVVAATVAGVIIAWASDGALVTFFNALLRQARSLVGA